MGNEIEVPLMTEDALWGGRTSHDTSHGMATTRRDTFDIAVEQFDATLKFSIDDAVLTIGDKFGSNKQCVEL